MSAPSKPTSSSPNYESILDESVSRQGKRPRAESEVDKLWEQLSVHIVHNNELMEEVATLKQLVLKALPTQTTSLSQQVIRGAGPIVMEALQFCHKVKGDNPLKLQLQYVGRDATGNHIKVNHYVVSIGEDDTVLGAWAYEHIAFHVDGACVHRASYPARVQWSSMDDFQLKGLPKLVEGSDRWLLERVSYSPLWEPERYPHHRFEAGQTSGTVFCIPRPSSDDDDSDDNDV